MSIESPATYGDAYWSSQLDAAKTFEEVIEKSIKPYVPSLFSNPEIRAAMPFDILPKLEGLLEFEHPGLGAIGGRFVSEIADQMVSMVMSPAMRDVQYAANRIFPSLRMSPDQATALFRRKRLAVEDFAARFRDAGYDEFVGPLVYQSTSPFPTLPELFRWAKYHGDPDNAWATLYDYVDLDPVDFPKFDWLSKQQLTTEQITALYRRGKLIEVDADLSLRQVGWEIGTVASVRNLSYVIPNAMLLLQGNLYAETTRENIFADLGHADIHPDYQQKYFDAVLTKPASADMIAYHLRQENDLANLDRDLRRIGIHPDYFDLYNTLARRIPPVADIISMAVREAFTPAIAERFGQYEDFPPEFARYAGQQGLSEEWAKRYWAAHWGLPSPQQGYEMLHRGVIDKADLELLMKAQDIMPFWRDKMVEIAYRPLTRVDVRRMYKEGILDESGVYKAYLDNGYSEDNAEAMTEFTIAYVLSQQSKFTSSDVVKAFTQRMIDRSEARSLLIMLNVKSSDAEYILKTAEYKREWELTDAKTSAIRNLYKRGEYNENQARSELLKLDTPAEYVDTMMEQWWYEKKEEPVKTWTKAEIFKFVKAEIITEERARTELQTMGYDQEHADKLVEFSQWIPSDE